MSDNPIQRLRRGEEVPREEVLADVDRLLDLYKKRGGEIDNLLTLLGDLRTHAKHGGVCTCGGLSLDRPCAWCLLWGRVDQAHSTRPVGTSVLRTIGPPPKIPQKEPK
jgi:hypothetical protein